MRVRIKSRKKLYNSNLGRMTSETPVKYVKYRSVEDRILDVYKQLNPTFWAKA